ncbi:Superfamily I DNA and RNA helicases [Aquiflexum balticum DSM 16537]|uniref:DNA 3'-5' helicase II n=1 Tax=Aquiflexum balticum DSM 16537 TaxID=758820 RepID=A0A1W2HBV8_9BACT|nr:3'-5' exonuclease [Aquiflexum balticum]SMD46365.1 Superfamily I DNA and RNA helicases [Aquiflexum balticum DSM 16537]
MPRRSFYINDSELDDYQVKIINKRTDNSFIVKGCAGSGKSILALWKAKQIQNEGKGSWLFVVFTKALKQYMSDGIGQIELNINNVENYHKCFFWSKDNGSWEKGDWKKGAFDYVIVDEAQDFSKDDILLFKSKARKALLLYGDSAQQLYKFFEDKKTISMEEIGSITKFQMEQLVFNHRLPKKIARVAQYVNSERDDLEDRCRNEGIEKPKILYYSSSYKQLDAIAEIVKNRNFVDVGILLRNNLQVKNVEEYLKSKGINVEAKVNDNIDLNFNSDNPKIMTYHSSKGLQFEAVFLPDCTSSDNDDRNPLYVALTRTYQSLYILHSGNLSSFFDTVPGNLYDTSIAGNTELL